MHNAEKSPHVDKLKVVVSFDISQWLNSRMLPHLTLATRISDRKDNSLNAIGLRFLFRPNGSLSILFTAFFSRVILGIMKDALLLDFIGFPASTACFGGLIIG